MRLFFFFRLAVEKIRVVTVEVKAEALGRGRRWREGDGHSSLISN
jgi:hypothetical protein